MFHPQDIPPNEAQSEHGMFDEASGFYLDGHKQHRGLPGEDLLTIWITGYIGNS